MSPTPGRAPGPAPPAVPSPEPWPAPAAPPPAASQAPPPAALDIRRLGLRYGPAMVIDGLDLAVDPGQLLAVVGPNGAGKTSLLDVTCRLARPATGSVHLFGRDMAGLRPHQVAAAGLARTFQHLGLSGGSTVLDNVLVGRVHATTSGLAASGLGLRRARREQAADLQVAAEALALVGAGAVAQRRAGDLPWGAQKRVELARALAMRPRLLALDEPVAGMGGDERAFMADLIRALRDRREMAILLVEHDMDLVMDVADRVLVLDSGRAVAVGTPAQVQADPAARSAYLGPLASAPPLETRPR
ncbi:MAG: ABC transporter ATP-binding protein [Acidimicrobiales bacterium]